MTCRRLAAAVAAFTVGWLLGPFVALLIIHRRSTP